MKSFLIWMLAIGLFCAFCVYSYIVRTSYNVDKQEAKIVHLESQISVLSYALSLLPKTERTDVFFNSIVQVYPSFKDDDILCEMLGYKKTKEEMDKDKLKAEQVEKAKEEGDGDTTRVEVMESVISAFQSKGVK